jgi:hypothetical protein
MGYRVSGKLVALQQAERKRLAKRSAKAPPAFRLYVVVKIADAAISGKLHFVLTVMESNHFS